MKRIVALDPGGTTGWASYTEYEDPAVMKFDWGQIGPEEHHLKLHNFLGLQQTDEFKIVCESFEFRQGKQRANINLISKEYIGIAKLFAAERLRSPVVFQTAGAAKGFVTDPKLKIMGLWVPGKQHARDALRHLLYYMITVERRVDLIKSWKEL